MILLGLLPANYARLRLLPLKKVETVIVLRAPLEKQRLLWAVHLVLHQQSPVVPELHLKVPNAPPLVRIRIHQRRYSQHVHRARPLSVRVSILPWHPVHPHHLEPVLQPVVVPPMWLDLLQVGKTRMHRCSCRQVLHYRVQCCSPWPLLHQWCCSKSKVYVDLCPRKINNNIHYRVQVPGN